MPSSSTALVLALLPFVLAQSSSAPAGSVTASVTQAIPASTVSLSIDPNIPQTPLTTVPSFTIPNLSALTSGAPTDATVALDTTYTGGSSPTRISGAPALPAVTAISPANYPSLDVLPPTDSAQVKEWLSKIDFSKVPNYSQTDGTCGGTPGAITDGRCWWTCGGCTRSTDITACPDKNTWGLSYDDGPSPYTPLLLDYLDAQSLTTTFFLVGSRVISRPQMVQSEYMAGHQLSVHTWSHPYLTKLTNEQIVAELGWTKKVIKDVTGVTPNTFRPPYGDIDDRVRAIAAQMGLTPIIWTSIVANGTRTNFDTTDWNIPGGTANGQSSLSRFNQILNTYVPQLDSGFIVLEHDLYQQSVDLAVGYILPQALKDAKYKLKSIISCMNQPLSEAYIETSSNNTATRIMSGSGGSTFFQPAVGTQTFSSASASSAGSGAASSGSAGSSAAGGSSSGSANAGNAAAASSSRAAGERVAGMGFKGVWGAMAAVLAIGAGMTLLA
ncbi:uncharacterized protein MKK02DRAFT_37340 [Dioszegia hungarica]|uniref:chitin deacetylase n=1 Tax=Dioszegia hungarica TaxID=4972 RepID=A0AA38HDU0_9TREE|nr:uncharacterized protein MKK02DRAFT_37340 [Dioszegia hungarica]KAI9636971.1 hypothetical protein MKK02DRAFT_37340 [Dioszegia hungarica]